ncbi:DUF1648 domain-containing protein [Rhodococcus sp. SGAir0479]|uniref:DUF1648 domain-containing protein n=1 Tax=Rhodococcus sp. SGAir0479 TaxID=2567884 RepID=UPI0010CD3042|nr:DUF1648 domain-containing protein [Rhodococcus sp. SGAir0479]QCQ90860.1 DUF1648 domain-containing protein [Rhodococcus sp. SGAir0479]
MTGAVVGQRVSWIRAAVGALTLPVVAATAAAVVLNAWSTALPDPIAVHFGPAGTADGFAAQGSARWWPLLGPSIALLLGVIVLLLTRRDVRAARMGTAVASGLGTAVAVLPVLLLAPQRDLPSAVDATFAAWWVAVAAVVGVVAGCAGVLPVGHPRAVAAQSVPPADAPRIALADSESVVWTGTAAMPRWLAVTLGVLPLVVAAAAAWGASDAGVPALVITAVVGALLMGLALAPVHVVVDGRGLETRYVLTGGRRRVPLDEVARADAVRIGLINRYGGIGYRVGPDGVGLLVRPGAALRVTRGDGSKFTVTVDGADQAAAVLNSLAARGRVAR